MTPEEKKARLERMRQIVSTFNRLNADLELVRELIRLAHHDDFTGMDKRRLLLERRLQSLQTLSQHAARERHMEEIFSLVSDFSAEISQFGDGNLRGGTGYQ